MKNGIGVVMLNTTFERIPGDIGNPATFPFPVLYQVVDKAVIANVIHKKGPILLPEFLEAAQKLEAAGVKAVTTSCGFLTVYQKEIQDKLDIPFLSSSLLQVPFLQGMTNGDIGIITASKANLSDQHLKAANIHPEKIVIEGMDDMPHFTAAIVQETTPLQKELVREEMKQIAQRLLKRAPHLKAIVLECTNMPPYKDVIKEITHLPIFDVVSLVHHTYNAI